MKHVAMQRMHTSATTLAIVSVYALTKCCPIGVIGSDFADDRI